MSIQPNIYAERILGNLDITSMSANTFTTYPIIGGNSNSAQTVNLLTSDQFTYTLTANTTFTFNNNSNGKSWMIGVTQNSITSGLTTSFSAVTATIKWPYAITPVMSTTTGSTDIYNFVQLNGTIFGNYSQQY